MYNKPTHMVKLYLANTAIVACLFCTSFISSCYDGKAKTQPEKQDPLTITDITERHVKIPNSNLYIIPPPGFSANELTGTITTEEGHPDILVMKIISGTTSEKIILDQKALADKEFPGSWKEDDITADGHTAKVYHIKSRFGTQYYFSFTDGHTDEMIIVNYDENDMATAKKLYEALKTVVTEK